MVRIDAPSLKTSRYYEERFADIAKIIDGVVKTSWEIQLSIEKSDRRGLPQRKEIVPLDAAKQHQSLHIDRSSLASINRRQSYDANARCRWIS